MENQLVEEIYVSFSNFCIEKGEGAEFSEEELTEAVKPEKIQTNRKLDAGDLLCEAREINLTEEDLQVFKAIEATDEVVGQSSTGNPAYKYDSFFKGDEQSLSKIKNFFASGNQKLSENIFIFDLPAGRCGETGACPFKAGYCPGCYAKNSEMQYILSTPQKRYRNMEMVKRMIEENKETATHNLSLLQRKLMLELHKRNATEDAVVRIHSSGDFFNEAYIQMWADIVKQYPSIFFYAYTKADKAIVLDSADNIRFNLSGGLEFDRERLLDFSALKNLPNFALISSYIDINTYDDEGKVTGKKTTFNFGGVNFVKEVMRTYPNNNLYLNAKKPFIVMNELGEAYPIVADYVVKKVKATPEPAEEGYEQLGGEVEDMPNTNEFQASERAKELTKQDPKGIRYTARQRKGGILTEEDKFKAPKEYAKSYDDYEVWLCPATNPSLRTKHLVTCGKSCKFCTVPTKKKRVAFWLH